MSVCQPLSAFLSRSPDTLLLVHGPWARGGSPLPSLGAKYSILRVHNNDPYTTRSQRQYAHTHTDLNAQSHTHTHVNSVTRKHTRTKHAYTQKQAHIQRNTHTSIFFFAVPCLFILHPLTSISSPSFSVLPSSHGASSLPVCDLTGGVDITVLCSVL